MLDPSMIEQLASDVCTTMLGLSLTPAGDPQRSGDTNLYCAHIDIEGDWHVQLCVICPVVLGTRIASAMFMMEPDELSEAEIGDAIGELVNIIGGNIKGVMPGESSLSLPSVQQLDAALVTSLQGQNTDVHFICEEQALTIRYSEPQEACVGETTAT